jgi:uncharacterized protein YyaL (SSP411 family)
MTRCKAALLALSCVALAWPVSAAEYPGIPKALPGAPPLPESVRDELARALRERGAGYLPRTEHLRDDGSPVYTNRLLLETSPYLGQHAHNPVDWRPWGDEAFADAKQRGVPVLVSIGYSTCHWCHVMEEESFDNVDTARLLNQKFVAIKVDREMRPDVDQIYMSAVHAMGKSGGWPLNVFLTPDRKPFYGGTYFPPVERQGRPSFRNVLTMLSDEYAKDPARLATFGERLEGAIREGLESANATASKIPEVASLGRAARQTTGRIDREWGGVGQRTKFPSSVPLRFLLRHHRRTGDAAALELAVLTLERMAHGGIYDHVGGGFHRYATDRRWLIPHFEKMLYDNALLAVVYLEAWQATGREDFARVVRETLDYVAREMTSPGGGFYSATDADSTTPEGESEEGWFFTWTPDEIESVLGADAARSVAAWYGVRPEGNFEGRNIFHTWRTPAVVATELGISPEQLATRIATAREKLYTARLARPAPLRDDKILAAWNGLMISAFARAGFSFDEPRYLEIARRAADFVLAKMRDDGRLLRAHQGTRASGPAFLEDYTFVIAALLDLYEASPDPRWLREALALQSVLDTHYADNEGGGYYKVGDDHEKLLAREKPNRDGAVPSGNSVAALNLLRLTEFTGDDDHRARAMLLFSAMEARFSNSPSAFGELLLALDYHWDATKEVVIVAPPSRDSVSELLAPLRTAFVPNRIVAVVTQGPDLDAHAELVPLVSGKRAIAGKATAYVCENQVCAYPTSDPKTFERQLRAVKPPK